MTELAVYRTTRDGKTVYFRELSDYVLHLLSRGQVGTVERVVIPEYYEDYEDTEVDNE